MATRAPTAANRMHLAKRFLEAVTARYGMSRLGRQELDGELLLDAEGALWSWEMLEAAREPRALELTRVVVAIDPPVTGGPDADECGIVVAGVPAGRAAAGLGGGGDRRRQRRGRCRRAAGRSGRWRSSTRMAPTGWSPRSTRAATWSRT